ncbi:MAG: DUF370 domain-containing protein [Clostridia bacterium]|nr:DUF370 domain-containing protein [Clostridia bacterium]
MYLHIGNGINIKKKSIIGIFDLDSSTVSGTTRKYINKNQRDGNITYADYDLPRAFVLHGDGQGGYKIKLSRISSQGLKLRLESDDYSENG